MPERTLYPLTRREETESELAGVVFPDPYQWLEDDTDEVRQWQRDQAKLAAETVKRWLHFDALRDEVARLSIDDPSPLSRRWAAGLWFRISSDADRSVVLVSESLTGKGRVLFDPAAEDPGTPAFLSWIAPSPDGRILAVGVCSDGSENNNVRLIDVETRQPIPNPPTQVMMDTWSGGAHWRMDSSGFYFAGLSGDPHDFDQHIYFHDVTGPGFTTEVEVPLPSHITRDWHVVRPSQCGRWLVAAQRMLNPIPIALFDLQDIAGWKPFVTDVDGMVVGRVVGDAYVGVTDIGAPRGRIVSIPLRSATPNDPSTWREIVPESDAAIRNIRLVGETLYVNELIDAYGRVRMFSLDGEELGEVPLPGRGTVFEEVFQFQNFCTPYDEGGFLFDFCSFTSSWGTYLHRPGSEMIDALVPPDVELEGILVEDRSAISADGTRIPYHVLRKEETGSDKPRPALVYAYGGFNCPWFPKFPERGMAAFVEAGGLFVHCHLRGGGEFGSDWWKGGSRKNKQNCYADLYAIAEDLIERGVSQPDMMGVTGLSNGGLMTGVAVVQRPDLWRVAVPRVPMLDVIGACRRDPYGRMAVGIEFGDPDDPEEVRRMAKFSPCQLVEKGVAYPAVYIDAGDTDPRAPAWHSRKFAALLQAAQSADAPILVHIWENVGHGAATPKAVEIAEWAEWIAFVMQQLNMVPRGQAEATASHDMLAMEATQ